MYVRIKKIKGIRYAYLVKSCWSRRKKKPRQKTIQYLGKVYTLPKVKNALLEDHLGIKNTSSYFEKTPIKKIIKSMIEWELYNHNFEKTSKNVWVNNNIVIDLVIKKIYNSSTKRLVCIEMNNNFLTTKALRNLINLSVPPGLTDVQIGKYLVNSFLSAGINVPKDEFITLSQRIIDKIKK